MKYIEKFFEHFDLILQDIKQTCGEFREMGLKMNFTHGFIRKKKDKERNAYKIELLYENIDKKYPTYGDLSPVIESLQNLMSDFTCSMLGNVYIPKDDWRWVPISIGDPPPPDFKISYLKIIFTEK